jgi:cytochrome P450
MTLVSRSLGRVPFATRVAGQLLGDPMRRVPGKPLERWLLVVDLPTRKLALSNDANVVETVMLDRAGTFPKSAVLTLLLEPLVGKGVFGQPGGAAVKETRRIYARSLASFPEERIRDVTRETAARYIDRWLAAGPGGVPISEELSRLTIDVVSEVTLGARFGEAQSKRFTTLFLAYQKRVLPLVLMIAREDEATRRRIVREMGLPGIGAEMRGLIRETFVTPILDGRRSVTAAPFPAALAAEGGPESGAAREKRLLDEIAVMLLAGHETTAASLSWLFLELAQRSNLQEEAAAAVCGCPCASPIVHGRGELAAASREAALDALAKETLRLYPPIGFFLRETERDVTFREIPIPAGSFFIVAPWTLHRHRKLWAAPDEFRPARWLGPAEPPPRTSYMPFGLGARICPGARFAAIEMAEIIASTLARTRLSVVSGEDAKPLGNLTSRPDREIYLRMEPRPHRQDKEPPAA